MISGGSRSGSAAMRCAQLAAGMPPEEVRELGAEGQALYGCLGIGELGPDGRFVPAIERSTPRLSHWKLVPGDVLVLCTDGLVEEGVFLEPGDLSTLLTGETDRPARELAEGDWKLLDLKHVTAPGAPLCGAAGLRTLTGTHARMVWIRAVDPNSNDFAGIGDALPTAT
jgi:hypothetical protein